MKKILLLLGVFISLYASAQIPSGYLHRNVKEGVIAGYDDSTRTIPAAADHRLRGGSFRAGDIMLDSAGADSGFYYRTINGALIRLARAGEVSGSGGLAGGNLGSFFRLYHPGSQGIKTLSTDFGTNYDTATANVMKISVDSSLVQPKLTFTNSINKSNNTVYLVNDTTTCDTCAYGSVNSTKRWYPGAYLDTTGAAHGYFVQWFGGRLYKPVAISTTPPGNTLDLIINRNGAYAVPGSDSLRYGGAVAGLNNKGNYFINDIQVLRLPDQSSFLNDLIIGDGGSTLVHTTGITAQYITTVGKLAGNSLTSASSDVMVGSRAGQACSSCINTTLVGDGAGIAVTTASNVTAIGMGSASVDQTGSNIAVLGMESYKQGTAANATAIGSQSLHENTSGADNSAGGFQAGYQNQTGANNSWWGSNAGTGTSSNSNSRNSGFGYKSMFPITTGTDNTGAGYQTLINLTSGTFITALGSGAGGGITNGTHSLILGDGIASLAAAETGTVVIGANALRRIWINGNGKTIIGGSIPNTGGIGVDTSARLGTVNINGTLRIETLTSTSALDSVYVQDAGITKYVDLSSVTTTLAFGTYTPTITDGTNVASSSSASAHYIRVGNQVHVQGVVTIDPTSTLTNTAFEISLPIASNIGAITDLTGNGTESLQATVTATIVGSVANDTASVTFTSGSLTADGLTFSFTYTII